MTLQQNPHGAGFTFNGKGLKRFKKKQQHSLLYFLPIIKNMARYH